MADVEENRRLREQLAQAEATILNQDNEREERARQHELEMAKLQLQIAQANAANQTVLSSIININNQALLIFIIIDKSIIDYCNSIAILGSWRPPCSARG